MAIILPSSKNSTFVKNLTSFSSDVTWISFNGGKDSIVTFILAVLTLVKMKNEGTYKGKIIPFPVKYTPTLFNISLD